MQEIESSAAVAALLGALGCCSELCKKLFLVVCTAAAGLQASCGLKLMVCEGDLLASTPALQAQSKATDGPCSPKVIKSELRVVPVPVGSRDDGIRQWAGLTEQPAAAVTTALLFSGINTAARSKENC